MALAAHSYFGTLDQTANTNVYDYSPFFFRKPREGGECRLWPLLKKVENLNDTTCRWYEDNRLPLTFTAASNGAIDNGAGSTTLNLDTGQVAAKFVRIGDVFRDTAAGKRELLEVTAISTDALTVTRGFGGTTREAHANSAVFKLVYHGNPEGSAFSQAEGRNLTERTNTTGIIDQAVGLTRTQGRRQLQGGVGDPWAYQVAGALDKFEVMMEEAVLWSAGTARSATGPVYGSMDGIKQIITERAGTNYVTTAGTFDYELFDDAMKTLWENGYDENTAFILLVPPLGKQAAAYIHESAMRAPYAGFATRGMVAKQLLSTWGHEVPIVPNSHLQSDEMLILNLDLIWVRFVDTMLAYDLPLGTAGADKRQRRFISEFSLEMHNADTAHYYRTGVTYSRPE